jgi:outer membrane lipoprotein-sorting protein
VLIAVTGLLCVAAPTPEARRWIERVDEARERGGFEARFSVEMRMADGDRSVTVTVEGSTAQRDPEHVRTEARVRVTGVDEAEGGELAVLVVGDGEHFWIEQDGGGESAPQVTRLSSDSPSSAVPRGPGAGFGGGPTGWDLLRQVSTIAGELDLRLVEERDDRVVLRGAGAEIPGVGRGPHDVELVLDPATAFPVELRIGSHEAPTMRIRFDEVRFPEALPDERFRYTPPEGVDVDDLDRADSGP